MNFMVGGTVTGFNFSIHMSNSPSTGFILVLKIYFSSRLHIRLKLAGAPLHVWVMPLHQQGLRWPTEGRRTAMFKTDAADRQRGDVRRLEMVRAVAPHAIDAKIISKDQDEYGFKGGVAANTPPATNVNAATSRSLSRGYLSSEAYG